MGMTNKKGSKAEKMFMSEMEKLGVKFVDATPKDGAFLPKRHTAPRPHDGLEGK